MQEKFLNIPLRSIFLCSLSIWLITIPLQVLLIESIRIQIAHIGQFLSLFLLIPIFLKFKLKKYEILTIIFIVIYIFYIVINGYKNMFGMFLGIFYLISMAQFLIYLKYISEDEKLYFDVLKIIFFSARLTSFIILIDFLIDPRFFYGFFLQDKTYFLVFVYTLIFIEFSYFKIKKSVQSIWSYMYILFLIIISIATASRSFAFFTIFCFAILIDALKNKSINSNVKFIVLFSLVSVLGFISYSVLSITEALDIENPLYAFDRYLGVFEEGDNSSSSHFLFLQVAITEKFNNFYNFFFGVGLANFQFSVESSSLFGAVSQNESYMRYAVYSPSFLYMPGVSLWGELLLELPIFFFAIILFFTLKIIYDAIIAKDFYNLCFIFGLFGTGIFYSIHHSSCFYLALLVLYLVQYRTYFSEVKT